MAQFPKFTSICNKKCWIPVILVLCCSLTIGICIALVPGSVSRQDARRFPDGFLFGVATAAYQIEGAWDADGKTESIWDHLTHTRPHMVRDGSNGDIAANSYYLYKRDVEMMRELGLDFYRLSLSWTRILPTGFPDYINEAGVMYYNNLFDEMLRYNIQPVVTLFHWDLPQKLQVLGGFANPEIVNWFSDYARVVYSLFGNKVKYWITINEPHQICNYGYGAERLAPALNIHGIAEYMCAKNLLVAHATAYHIYNDEFRPTQRGSVFISLSAQWYEPASEDHVQAAYEAYQFYSSEYAHPIFSEAGDFPPLIKEKIARKSAEQGFPRSRQLQFTPEEIALIRGSADFFGLNHYSSYYAYRNESIVNMYNIPSFLDDAEVALYSLPEWKIGESDFTKNVPWGLYNLLTQIKNDYGNPPVFISENGFATHGGLNDDDRITYFRGYWNAVLDAIDNGSDIRAYTAWSLLDNFEWLLGYTECFGLYEVDYTSPNRTRTARKSAYVYKEMLRTRVLDPDYEPDLTIPMTIDEGN